MEIYEKWKWTIENKDEVKFCGGKEERSAWFGPYNGGKEERSFLMKVLWNKLFLRTKTKIAMKFLCTIGILSHFTAAITDNASM